MRFFSNGQKFEPSNPYDQQPLLRKSPDMVQRRPKTKLTMSHEFDSAISYFDAPNTAMVGAETPHQLNTVVRPVSTPGYESEIESAKEMAQKQKYKQSDTKGTAMLINKLTIDLEKQTQDLNKMLRSQKSAEKMKNNAEPMFPQIDISPISVVGKKKHRRRYNIKSGHM